MPKTTTFGGDRLDTESLRELINSDGGEEERAYRRGYQHGANEAFRVVEAFLTSSQKASMSKWIDKLGTLRRSGQNLPRAPDFTEGKRAMQTGPKGEKRPADVIGNAVKVMRIATREEPEDYGPDDGKDPAARRSAAKVERHAPRA